MFLRTRENNPKVCMESQKTSRHQSNAEKKEQSWRYKHLTLQTIPQSYSNQNSMALPGKRTDTQIHGTEQMAQKQTRTCTGNSPMKKEAIIYNGENRLLTKPC